VRAKVQGKGRPVPSLISPSASCARKICRIKAGSSTTACPSRVRWSAAAEAVAAPANRAGAHNIGVAGRLLPISDYGKPAAPLRGQPPQIRWRPLIAAMMTAPRLGDFERRYRKKKGPAGSLAAIEVAPGEYVMVYCVLLHCGGYRLRGASGLPSRAAPMERKHALTLNLACRRVPRVDSVDGELTV